MFVRFKDSGQVRKFCKFDPDFEETGAYAVESTEEEIITERYVIDHN